MIEQELPDFLTENTDGSIGVTLLRGVEVDGNKRMGLTLREPAVSDMLAAEAGSKSAAVSEVTLIANLAEVPPETIQNAKMRDYSRLQEALGFLNG